MPMPTRYSAAASRLREERASPPLAVVKDELSSRTCRIGFTCTWVAAMSPVTYRRSNFATCWRPHAFGRPRRFSVMPASSQTGLARPGDLLPVARAELLAAMGRATEAVRLASPFLSRAVASDVAAAGRAGGVKSRRLLCALTERNVAARVLSAYGLQLLLDAGWEIRSVPNLHAKVAVIDRSWGLVGSGNLTGAGIGKQDSATGNIELGVVLDKQQIILASGVYEVWWHHPKADDVTVQKLAPFLVIEDKAKAAGKDGRRVGKPIPLSGSEAAMRRRLTAETGLWAKAMNDRPSAGEWWMTKTWIHDRHWNRVNDGITHRPGYAAGDRIVLYVIEPQLCPAIYLVTGPAEDRRDLVRATYGDDEADRFGWVTPVEPLGAVVRERAPGLGGLGVHPQSLQNGYVRIRDRAGYKRLERRLTR